MDDMRSLALAVLVAALEDEVEIIILLLSLPTKFLSEPILPTYENTLMHCVVMKASFQVIALLSEAECDWNPTDKRGRTPLHILSSFMIHESELVSNELWSSKEGSAPYTSTSSSTQNVGKRVSKRFSRNLCVGVPGDGPQERKRIVQSFVKERVRIAEYIIEQGGADVEKVDEGGYTALEVALYHRYVVSEMESTFLNCDSFPNSMFIHEYQENCYYFDI